MKIWGILLYDSLLQTIRHTSPCQPLTVAFIGLIVRLPVSILYKSYKTCCYEAILMTYRYSTHVYESNEGGRFEMKLIVDHWLVSE